MRKLILVCMVLVASSCELVQQAVQMKNFAECEFVVESVTDMRLGDMLIMDEKGAISFSLMDMIGLSQIFSSGAVPLFMQLNLLVSNPNPVQARMNQLEWMLYADTTLLAEGVFQETILLAPNGGEALMPVEVSMDLLKVLGGEDVTEILKYVMSFSSDSDELEEGGMYVQLKPSFVIDNKTIPYPGYIKVKL